MSCGKVELQPLKQQPPKDLSHHLSRNAKNRVASNIKQFYKYFSIPGIGQLAGGLPNEHNFPFDSLEATAALPDRFKPTPNRPVDPPPTQDVASLSLNSSLPASRVIVPRQSGTEDRVRKIDVASALQYGQASGYPPLYSFLRQFTRHNLHPNCPYADGPDIILTVGATDGFSKVVQLLTNEWDPTKNSIKEKQGLLCEEYAYTNALQAARPRGMNIVPVAVDDEGMCASGRGGLQEVLEGWDEEKGQRPHMMYTVTMGQNPTSGVLSLERRREIYKVCQKYDVIIVEDDPYWYLQYPSATSANIAGGRTAQTPTTPKPADWKSTGYDFLDSIVPSSISIDTDGRVIRLDTFSKTVAPGCRMGWITAQPAFIERLLRLTETSTQQPSGFVQSIIAELLLGPGNSQDPGRGGAKDGSGWDVSGWVRWLEGLRGNYERRMNVMCKIFEEGKYQVKAGRRRSLTASPEEEDSDEWSVVEKVKMYDFVWPVGGMFTWLKVNFDAHPLIKKVDGAKLSRALWILWTTKPFLVLASPGTIFGPTDEIKAESAWRFFRVSFAAVDEDVLAPASHRLVDGFRAFWRIKDVKEIDDLLDDSAVVEERADLGSLIGPCC